jgi:hypothetical protein
MWLNTAFYLETVPDRVIQFIAPLGTIYFYFGLGFFFSGSGLIYIATTLSIPMPAEDNYSNPYFLVFRMFSCISQVFLNAIFNQGWDVVTKSSERIEKKQNKITEELQTLSNSNLSQYLISSNPTTSSTNSTEPEVSAFWHKIILFCIFVDSFVFGISAMAGTSKANEVAKDLVPFIFKHRILLSSLPIVVGLGILFSQIIYSFVLGGRDGAEKWKMIAQQYIPRFIKECVNTQDTVPYFVAIRPEYGVGRFFEPLQDNLGENSLKSAGSSLSNPRSFSG